MYPIHNYPVYNAHPNYPNYPIHAYPYTNNWYGASVGFGVHEMRAECWSLAKVQLNQLFRSLWEQHVFWTRLTVNSIAAQSPDLEPTVARLLRNATDLGRAFEPYYGTEIAREFERLVHDHLTIAAELVTALRDGKQEEAEAANKRWFRNADDIARFLGRINPYWSEAEWRAMYYDHLNLLTEEVASRLAGDYVTNVATSDKVQQQALMMADTMSQGITMQFPQFF